MKFKNKKLYKIVLFTTVFVVFLIGFSQISFASRTDVGQFEDNNDPTLSTPIKEIMGMGLRVVQVVAGGVAFIVLLILGIKYLTSAPDGKAASKKAFIYYVVGFLIAMLGQQIIGAIANLI